MYIALRPTVPQVVTILRGGQVTFQIHGGGHAFAIYEVSKDTTRDELGQFLCPGTDPSTIRTPEAHTCNQSADNAAANGQLITYSFLKTGRYLVICMNRSHFLNDWMFGFVNVVGED